MKNATQLRETANAINEAKEKEIFKRATEVAEEIISKCEEAAENGHMHRTFNRNEFGVLGRGDLAEAVFKIIENHGFEISGKVSIIISW